VRIVSKTPLLLDEVFNDLKKEHIKSEKMSQKSEGAMGDITTCIALSTLGIQAIDTLISYLSYRVSQKNNYIYFTYKDGRTIKLNNLSKEEQQEKLHMLKDSFDDLEYLEIG
jgi:uncharacterized protein YsxB (DUF464 family)